MIQKSKNTHDIINLLHHVIHQKDLLKPNQSMILAISGGQDSITLFFIFLQLREQWDWKYQLIYCHHLWQKDSFYTILHLFKLAYLLHIPIAFTFTLQKVLTEQLARDWRSLTFQRITEHYLVSTIILGHSKSDRVETGLFNLFRGSSTKGVSTLNWTSLVLKSLQQNSFFLNQKSLKSIKRIASTETGFYIPTVDKNRSFFIPNNQSVSKLSRNKVETKMKSSFLLLGFLTRFLSQLWIRKIFCFFSAVKKKKKHFFFCSDNITKIPKRKEIKRPNPQHANPSYQCFATKGTRETPFDFFATYLPCLVDLQPIVLLNIYEKHFFKLKPMMKAWEKRILNVEPVALSFFFLFLTNLSVKCFTSGFVGNPLLLSEDIVLKRFLIYKSVSVKCKTRYCSGYVFTLSLQDSSNIAPSSLNTNLFPKRLSLRTLFFHANFDPNPASFFTLRRTCFVKKKGLRRFVRAKLKQDYDEGVLRQGRGHSQCKRVSPERAQMRLTKMRIRLLRVLIFSYNFFEPIFYKSHPVLVRPFLSLTRFDLKKLCNSWEIPLFPDQSNQKVKYQRNRIRKQLLPALRFLFNPQIDTILFQFIEIINSEQNYMDFITCRIIKSFKYKKQKRVGKEKLLFAVLPKPLRRKVIKQFLEDLLKRTTRFIDIEIFLYSKLSRLDLALPPFNPNTKNTQKNKNHQKNKKKNFILNTNDDWLPSFTLFFGAKSKQALASCDSKQTQKTHQQVSTLYKKKDERCWYQASKNRSEQGLDVWCSIPKYKIISNFLWLISFMGFIFFLFFYKKQQKTRLNKNNVKHIILKKSQI